MSLIPLRIGTPLFVARLIRNPTIPGRCAPCHSPMPQLEGDALKLYEECVRKRLDKFSPNKLLIYHIKEDKDIRKEYSHRLSYDAESILWLLLWWAIQIQPKDGDHRDRIPGGLWVALTADGDDHRDFFLSGKMKDVCHPDYRGLDQLLISLFEQLKGYQEYVTLPPKEYRVLSPEHDVTRMEEEYLHEALQRTILAFIVQNHKEGFMKAQISPTRRRKEEGAGMSQSTKTPITMNMKRTVEQEGTVGGTPAQGRSRRIARGK
jgi:hypothetical protein